MVGKAEDFRRRGLALPLEAAPFDVFNAEIQSHILAWEHIDPMMALELAQVKLEVNKRFYEAMRPSGS